MGGDRPVDEHQGRVIAGSALPAASPLITGGTFLRSGFAIRCRVPRTTHTAMGTRMLSEEQVLMRDSCRAFVDDVVIPFIRKDWQREWTMVPEERLPPEILAGADEIGIRTLGVPDEFGGV